MLEANAGALRLDVSQRLPRRSSECISARSKAVTWIRRYDPDLGTLADVLEGQEGEDAYREAIGGLLLHDVANLDESRAVCGERESEYAHNFMLYKILSALKTATSRTVSAKRFPLGRGRDLRIHPSHPRLHASHLVNPTGCDIGTSVLVSRCERSRATHIPIMIEVSTCEANTDELLTSLCASLPGQLT
mgnify:FL=1